MRHFIKIIVAAGIISVVLNIIAFLFDIFNKGGSVIVYLSHWGVNAVLVTLITFPYLYVKWKKMSFTVPKLLLCFALIAATAIFVSWGSMVLFYILSVIKYGPPV